MEATGKPRRRGKTGGNASSKRRGRPAKAQPEATASEDNRRRRGRPPKAKEAVPKRGPGRPPKYVAPAEPVPSEAPVQEAPPKRRPGRPRKAETAVAPAPVTAAPPVTSLDLSALPADVSGRLGELSMHALGFFRALLNLGQEEVRAAQKIEVLTHKQVAILVDAKDADVLEAIRSGRLKATPVGKGYRTTPNNVRAWLEGT